MSSQVGTTLTPLSPEVKNFHVPQTCTFWIQQSGDSVFSFGDVEGRFHALAGSLRFDGAPVDQIGSVSVDDGAEGKSISPGLGEVLDVDSWVLVGGAFRPSEEVVLGGNVRFLAHHDVRDLKRRKIHVRCV